MANTYFIEENTFESVVESKLKRIVKKCEKNGNPFTYKVKGTKVKGVDKDNRIAESEDDIKAYYNFVEIEVEGIALVGEYEVLAMLEYNPNGNIIKALNGNEEEIPQKFWHSDCTCDHCKTNRMRAKMFVVRNTESNEYSQVGSTCLKEFTGRLDTEWVASLYDSIIKLEEEAGRVGDKHGEKLYDVRTIIGNAITIINKLGYSKSDSGLPTKTLVSLASQCYTSRDKVIEMNRMCNDYRYDERFDVADFTTDNNELIEQIIEYYQSLNPDTSFIHNIQVMLEKGYIKAKDMGYITYLPQGYAVYLGKVKERAKRNADDKNSKHFGEVGKRYRNQKILSFVLLTSWETYYGLTKVYKIKLENGEILIWKTTNNVGCEIDEINDIDFTVKAHTEYNGINQTEITRVKVNMA